MTIFKVRTRISANEYRQWFIDNGIRYGRVSGHMFSRIERQYALLNGITEYGYWRIEIPRDEDAALFKLTWSEELN